MFRLRARDGAWRQFETVRTASSAGLPGGRPGEPATGWCCTCATSPNGAAPSSSSSGWPTPTTSPACPTGPGSWRRSSRAAPAPPRASPAACCCSTSTASSGQRRRRPRGRRPAARARSPPGCAPPSRDGDLVAPARRRRVRRRWCPAPPRRPTGARRADRRAARTRTVRAAGPRRSSAPGFVFDVSGSIGVAAAASRPTTCRPRIRQADLALRAAKAAGKNCVRASGQAIDSATAGAPGWPATCPLRSSRTSCGWSTSRSSAWPTAASSASRRSSAGTTRCSGTVPPEEFISLAEDDGLIVPLQRWVLRTRDRRRPPSCSPRAGTCRWRVNVSVRHLQAGCLAPDVAHALARVRRCRRRSWCSRSPSR